MRPRRIALPSIVVSRLRVIGVAGALVLCACRADPARSVAATLEAAPPPPPPPSESSDAVPGYLKGQLHLHSAASGDSETPPSFVVHWYADAGYDFVVFTDHNRITQAQSTGEMLVFPGIELTANPPACDPPPEPGLECLLHVNGLFVDPARGSDLALVERPAGNARVDIYAHALEATRALRGIAVLNHPNFHYAADVDLLVALAARGLTFFEVANEAVDSNNGGDDEHPSTEALWDAALTAGARLFGVATDDAHHYDDALRVRAAGGVAHVGDRGWVMVRASRDEASIRDALLRGDFYATNGVLLADVASADGWLRVEVAQATEPVSIAFIGERGEQLERVDGRAATFELASAASRYVRAVVRDGAGKKAWVQPVWP